MWITWQQQRARGEAFQLQRVLVVKSRSLLVAGVDSLLSREPDLNVIAITPEDEAALIEEIRRSQPDAIVLDEGSHLIDAAQLLALLKDYPELRVVVLRADNSLAQIYAKQQVVVARITDLVSVIRDK